MSLPETIKIGEQVLELAVFRVNTRRENGTPAQLTFVGPNDTVELSKDEQENHFLVGYLPKSNYSLYAGQIPEIPPG